MISVLYYKYYYFLYIFSQSYFSGSENNSYLETEGAPYDQKAAVVFFYEL